MGVAKDVEGSGRGLVIRIYSMLAKETEENHIVLKP
jgi:hypothetical protein